MSERHSVTLCIDGLKVGDEDAAKEIVERYFERLVALAQKRYPIGNRTIQDEEDAALSALRSFCDKAAKGRFSRLKNRNELWSLLAVITKRKVCDYLNREKAQKRGGGEQPKRVLTNNRPENENKVRDPVLEVMLNETVERCLQSLENPQTRKIARLLLDGYSATDIAEKVDVSQRTVYRKHEAIKEKWGFLLDELA